MTLKDAVDAAMGAIRGRKSIRVAIFEDVRVYTTKDVRSAAIVFRLSRIRLKVDPQGSAK